MTEDCRWCPCSEELPYDPNDPGAYPGPDPDCDCDCDDPTLAPVVTP